MTQPTLFLSHGAPSFALEPAAARTFLKSLGTKLDRPSAILVVSAHYVRKGPAVTSDATPETIYDFRGFPPELYSMTYPAPGDPALAQRLVSTLQRAGYPARLQARRGFDHGTWIPLKLMLPAADIPVVQLSIDISQGPLWHYELGKALAQLCKENVLIIGSGSLTHGLPDFFNEPHTLEEAPPAWVSEFADWMQHRIESGAIDEVLRAIEEAPHGRRNHPTLDHLLPLFVAMGASHDGSARALHRSTTYGILAMDAYGFGDEQSLSKLSDPHSLPSAA